MPTKIINDVYHLTPACQKRVLALLDDAKTELPNLVVFETFRTQERQAYLYGLGRNNWQMMFAYPKEPDFWQYSNINSPIRTSTIHSYHLTKNAVDFCFDYGKGYSWNGDWDTLRELGKRHGLESLYPYENSHLQYNPKYNLNLQLMTDAETLAKELWTEADQIHKECLRGIEKAINMKNKAHDIAERARNS